MERSIYRNNRLYANFSENVPVKEFWQQAQLYWQQAQLSLRWADRTSYIRRPASDFRSRKKANSQSEYSPIHAIVTLLCRTLQSTLGYDTVIRPAHVRDGCRQKLRIKIATKPLQIVLTVYRKLRTRLGPISNDTYHCHPYEGLATILHDWYGRVHNDPSRLHKVDSCRVIWNGLAYTTFY